jgi:hypothetical protein
MENPGSPGDIALDDVTAAGSGPVHANGAGGDLGDLVWSNGDNGSGTGRTGTGEFPGSGWPGVDLDL